jgi:tetratricopeptide (TPR) repeat protein
LKLPAHVLFRKELSLMVWKRHDILDQALVNEIVAFVEAVEERDQKPFNRFADLSALYAVDLNFNGQLRFWLGWTQDVAGDHATAQESWRQARSELEIFLKDQPGNYGLMRDLALTEAGLRDKAAASALSERAIATIPIEKDVVDGPGSIEVLARVATQTGEPDRAIAALQKLLSVSYQGPLGGRVPITPALLRLDPMFDPIRNDPRFQKIVSTAPQADN